MRSSSSVSRSHLFLRGLSLLLVLMTLVGTLSACGSVLGSNRPFAIKNKTTVQSQNFSFSKEHLSVVRFFVGQQQLTNYYRYLFLYYGYGWIDSPGYDNVPSYMDPYGTFSAYRGLPADRYVYDHINALSPRGEFDEAAHSHAQSILTLCEAARAAGAYDTYLSRATAEADKELRDLKEVAEGNQTSFSRFIKCYMGKSVTEEHLRTVLTMQSIARLYKEKLTEDYAAAATPAELEQYRDTHKEDFYVSTYVSISLPNKELADRIQKCASTDEVALAIAEYYFDREYDQMYQKVFSASSEIIDDPDRDYTREQVYKSVLAELGFDGYEVIFQVDETELFRKAARKLTISLVSSLRSRVDPVLDDSSRTPSELSYVELPEGVHTYEEYQPYSDLQKWLFAKGRASGDFTVIAKTSTNENVWAVRPEQGTIVSGGNIGGSTGGVTLIPGNASNGLASTDSSAETGAVYSTGNNSFIISGSDSYTSFISTTSYTLYIACDICKWDTEKNLETLYDLYYVNLADDPTDQSISPTLPENPISAKEKADIFWQALNGISDPEMFADKYAELVSRYQTNASTQIREKLSANNLNSDLRAWVTNPLRQAGDLAILPLPQAKIQDETETAASLETGVTIGAPEISDIIITPLYPEYTITIPSNQENIFISLPGNSTDTSIRYPQSDVYFVALVKQHKEPAWMITARQALADQQIKTRLAEDTARFGVTVNLDESFKPAPLISVSDIERWVGMALPVLLTLGFLVLFLILRHKRTATLTAEDYPKHKKAVTALAWIALSCQTVNLALSDFQYRVIAYAIGSNSSALASINHYMNPFSVDGILRTVSALAPSILLLLYTLCPRSRKSARVFAGCAWATVMMTAVLSGLFNLLSIYSFIRGTDMSLGIEGLLIYAAGILIPLLMLPATIAILRGGAKKGLLVLGAIGDVILILSQMTLLASHSFIGFLLSLIGVASSVLLMIALLLVGGRSPADADATVLEDTEPAEEPAVISTPAPVLEPAHKRFEQQTAKPLARDEKLDALTSEQALRYLQNQRDLGIITEEEFEQRKHEVEKRR